jgi:hypothetical protein
MVLVHGGLGVCTGYWLPDDAEQLRKLPDRLPDALNASRKLPDTLPDDAEQLP